MRIRWHFVLALVVRAAFVLLGYVQDSLSEVKYTDVDYRVFTDAARHLAAGRSPYLRPTYRYTPLVALLLVPNLLLHDACGKLLFCLFDLLASLLIYHIQKRSGLEPETCRASALLWLYNPLPVVISTRGSAESLVTFLVVLCVRLAGRPVPMGLVFGLAVHFKIYPCIYALSFYLALSKSLWPSKTQVLFVSMAAFGFLVPTLASLHLYGDSYLQEALLYHVTRKDIRHNFSPFFYALYLLESRSSPALSAFLSSCGFVIQGALIALVSLSFPGPSHLPACMFVQTALFVSLNKVCTSQYFAWYLCLLPLTYPLIKSRREKVLGLFVVWALGQVLWLVPAYYLEFEGKNTFFFVFVASLVFFSINIYLVCLFIGCMKLSCMERRSKEIKTD